MISSSFSPSVPSSSSTFSPVCVAPLVLSGAYPGVGQPNRSHITKKGTDSPSLSSCLGGISCLRPLWDFGWRLFAQALPHAIPISHCILIHVSALLCLESTASLMLSTIFGSYGPSALYSTKNPELCREGCVTGTLEHHPVTSFHPTPLREKLQGLLQGLLSALTSPTLQDSNLTDPRRLHRSVRGFRASGLPRVIQKMPGSVQEVSWEGRCFTFLDWYQVDSSMRPMPEGICE